MKEIQFSDGFDRPEVVAFGLAPAQLIAVVSGALVIYAVLHLALPTVLKAPLTLGLLAATGLVGWLRVGDRPVLEWLDLAARFGVRCKSGGLAPRERVGADAAEGLGAESLRRTQGMLIATGARSEVRSRCSTAVPSRWRGMHADGHRAAPGRPGRRLVFFSLAGGVGRTTLTTEVACLLATRRPSGGASSRGDVVLLDLDLSAPAVGIRLGLSRPTVWDLISATPERRHVGEHLAEHRSGLKVLVGASKPLALSPVARKTHWAEDIVSQLEGRGPAALLFDVGSDLGELSRWALSLADDVYVVFTPTVRGFHDAYRSTEVLRRLGAGGKLRYVLNRARGSPGLEGRTGDLVREAMSDLGGELVARIPDDPALEAAENLHRPATLDSRGPAVNALRRLAAHIETSCRS
ncbi:MAG TPA: hypothetical protein VE219_06605 [Candidatus Sulfotelmatobacter sp.]|nr:hypothetical protein [Candidatus Sulfotelmatobacter sp.]